MYAVYLIPISILISIGSHFETEDVTYWVLFFNERPRYKLEGRISYNSILAMTSFYLSENADEEKFIETVLPSSIKYVLKKKNVLTNFYFISVVVIFEWLTHIPIIISSYLLLMVLIPVNIIIYYQEKTPVLQPQLL